MARKRSAVRKDHRPWYVGRPAPQLTIDEIGEAAEQQPDRCDRTGDVAQGQHRHSAYRGKAYDGGDAAEKPAMKRHAAFPDLEDLQRVRDEIRQIVEQHVAGASSKDDAERHPKDEIVEVLDLQRRRPGPVSLVAYNGARIEPAEKNSEDVRQRIPADREGSDGNQHGVEIRKRSDRDRHERASFAGSPGRASTIARSGDETAVGE